MNSETSHHEFLRSFAKELREKGEAFDEIEKQLAQKSTDEAFIMELVKKLKKDHHDARRANGVQKLVMGSCLLLTGFILTVVNFHANNSFTIIMYGSSLAGISLLFWGMYETLG